MPTTICRAILSVADKTGLVPIAAALREHGIALYATGETGNHLRRHAIETLEIVALTGHPPMLDGRVKALHPAVFAGLLAREGDEMELAAQGYAPIAFLIAGLAPVAAEGADLADMDIGGPAMIRAAIKNEARVVLATDPGDYGPIIAALVEGRGVDPALRRHLAQRALERLLDYDAALLRRLRSPARADDGPPQPSHGIPLPDGESPQRSGMGPCDEGKGAATVAGWDKAPNDATPALRPRDAMAERGESPC